VGSNDLTQAGGGSATGLNSGLNSTDIATDHDADQTGTDLLRANQSNVSSLYHCIGSFDSGNETAGFNHTKSFVHCSILLKILFVSVG
jgi:hypothetical protein